MCAAASLKLMTWPSTVISGMWSPDQKNTEFIQ
jgi:hypothetical protein